MPEMGFDRGVSPVAQLLELEQKKKEAAEALEAAKKARCEDAVKTL